MSAGLQRRIEFEPQLVELLNAVCVTLESAEDFYRVEVERLRRGARTTAFVPLLATKRLHEDVRRRLRSQRLGPRPEIAEPAGAASPRA